MSSTQNGRDEDGELHTFEKNRYFHGKLMTARDMLAEQDYHGGRLAATNRYVNGQGIVCGVDVDETDGGLREEEGELRVALRPGFALDGSGRPVVVTGGAPVTVKDPETNQPGVPAGDPPEDIDLYLRYDECDVETVPRPGSENACEEECTYNRILEVFDVVFEGVDERDATVETGDPDAPEAGPFPAGYKPVLDVAFPGPGDVTEDEEGAIPLDDPGLLTIAREYYDTHFSTCRDGTESWVFLGTFTDPTGDGTWERVEEGLTHGSLVYTNDMLYAAVARHTADFHNPHHVTLDVREEGGTTSVHVRDDESDGGDVELNSPDGTLGITGTPRDGATSATVDLTVDVGQVAAAIDAVTTIDGVPPTDGGNVDLVPSGAVTITPGTNQVTIDVPETDPVERIGNATPDGTGRINISGTEGVSVTTTGNEITVEGPGTVAAPDLGPVVESMIRRSITCKHMSYSAALERFLDVLDNNITDPMDAVVTATSRFLGPNRQDEFTREGYARFMEAIFPAESALNADISDGQVSTESAERYRIGFTELDDVTPGSGRNTDLIDDNGDLTVDDERLLAIIAAQDCLARAVSLLRQDD